jgi:hypothetical protein
VEEARVILRPDRLVLSGKERSLNREYTDLYFSVCHADLRRLIDVPLWSPEGGLANDGQRILTPYSI